MVQFVQVEFDAKFNGMEYFRNNRSSGQKSLRCFPHCCGGKHRANGFCGAPIYATAILQKTHIPLADVMIVGQLRPQMEPQLSIETGLLKKQDIQNQIRSEENKRAELLPATWEIRNETEDSYELRVVLNASLRSYDYFWKSNRWVSGITTHVVDIILLAKDVEGDMTVISSACSDPFVVVSTKGKNLAVDTTSRVKPTKAVSTRGAMAATAPVQVIPSSSDESRVSESEGASLYQQFGQEFEKIDLVKLVHHSSYIFDVEYQRELADQGEQLRHLRRLTDGRTREYSHSASARENIKHVPGDGWVPHASVGQSLIVLPQYIGC